MLRQVFPQGKKGKGLFKTHGELQVQTGSAHSTACRNDCSVTPDSHPARVKGKPNTAQKALQLQHHLRQPPWETGCGAPSVPGEEMQAQKALVS